jgi:predicted DNA-binding transcriptional regulator AlpA
MEATRVRILTVGEAAAKLTLAVSTLYLKIKNRDSETPRFPAPIAITGRRVGFLEQELDLYLAECAAMRDAAAPKPKGARQVEGQQRYWDAVRRGERVHPRTAGRLRREAERANAETGGAHERAS